MNATLIPPVRIGFNEFYMVLLQGQEIRAIYDTYNNQFVEPGANPVAVIVDYIERVIAPSGTVEEIQPQSYSDSPARVPQWLHEAIIREIGGRRDARGQSIRFLWNAAAAGMR